MRADAAKSTEPAYRKDLLQPAENLERMALEAEKKAGS